mgnify:CR=1 FL=1
MQAQQTIVHSEAASGAASNGKNLQEKRFSAGAISATVWKNAGTSKQGEPVEYRTITLQRSFKKDGAWQNANSLRLNDLPKASLLLNKAFEWLVLKGGAAEIKEDKEAEENTEF